MLGRRNTIARPRGATAAPLVQAQLITAHAGFGPAPRAVASPAAQATQTTFAPQADGVNTARIMMNGNGDIVGGESGFGRGTRKYNASQINWIMSRGASGGSLSHQDQAIYDRMMYLRAQKEAAAQKDTEEQKAAEAAAAKRKQEMGDKLFSAAFQQGLNGQDIGAMDDAAKQAISDNAMKIAEAAMKKLSAGGW